MSPRDSDPRDSSRIDFEVRALIHDENEPGNKLEPTTSDDTTDIDLQNADGVVVTFTNADGVEVTKTAWGPFMDWDHLIDIVDSEVMSYYE
jgi:hypothetical protein